MAVHHFCLTKGFQKTPDYSAIYHLESHLTVFYIAQIVPSFVFLYLNSIGMRIDLMYSAHVYGRDGGRSKNYGAKH